VILLLVFFSLYFCSVKCLVLFFTTERQPISGTYTFYCIGYNVLRLPDGFYFGLSWHCRFVKNIAIKIEKLLTEIYIAIFSLQEV